MPFKKGKSGNPSGRPKELKEVQELAKKYTPEALTRLVEWMKSDNAKASVAACNSLLDRAWGRPAQQVDATLGGNFTVSWKK